MKKSPAVPERSPKEMIEKEKGNGRFQFFIRSIKEKINGGDD